MASIKGRLSSPGLAHLLVVTLVFGSLWGLSEVALGGSLRSTDFPYRSGLLTAIGMAAMAAALAISGRPIILLGIGAVAALVINLSVPILHTAVLCKANSSIALIIEAGSLGLVSATLMRKSPGNTYSRMGGGFLAALLASAVFYFVGTHAVPCAYLLSFTSPMSFVVKEGLVWATFTAVLLPLGYLAGERLAERPLAAFIGRSAYYGTAGGVIALSWGASALAIAAGL